MRRRKRRRNIQHALLAIGALIVVMAVIVGVKLILEKKGIMEEPDDSVAANTDPVQKEEEDGPTEEELAAQAEAEREAQKQEVMGQAERLALSYDYDAAIELLKTLEGYDLDEEIQAKITEYETTRDSCVPVNINEVTHIFYHSLVVDPHRAFDDTSDPQTAGNSQWMTTISEFEKITQEMYDRGYVMVGIHDLVEVTTDENGNTVYEPGTILLPPGKKAFVLSLDDLCYYHSYDGYGFASKLLVDENGNLYNEYIQEDGTTVTGDFDVVPLMDKFIEEHPDASYRGAKGIVALTGYNGILGYRTDSSYVDPAAYDGLDADKKQWLKDHPDFSLEEERAGAQKVADAMKAKGWEFASHTWGHLNVGSLSLERLQTDTQKWRSNVEPIVGATDVIIFAHGQDLGPWGAYSEDNANYKYLREQGYTIFCNVDGSAPYMVYFGEDYLRQGRRNLDGYRIYKNAIGEQDNLSDLFDAAEILDPERPPVPDL